MFKSSEARGIALNLKLMSLRLFAALSIPDDVAAQLLALMKGVAGAKWRPRENLHLTLRFFGEITEPVAEDLDAELESGRMPPRYRTGWAVPNS